MIIRIQSPEGIKRIEIDQNDKILSLFDKVRSALNLSSCSFKLFEERNKKKELKPTATKTVKQSNLKHGDIIYLDQLVNDTNKDVNVGASTSKLNYGDTNNLKNELKSSLSSINGIKKSSTLKEDNVDILLWKDNGLIHRDQDPAMCKHGSNAKCINCMPLEPFDENYLKENNIKHLSFHSYLKKQNAGIDKGKFAALENISCKIKSGCTDHLSWPKGICTKCQPNAVTLSRQQYRHVDNIVFENSLIVDQFLDYWRTTGHQRIGFLYGNYEKHTGVPLGIKANVLAIYEPPQESSSNFVKLQLPDKNESIIEDIAQRLGIKRIGWIFTDLISQDAAKGTVKHFRNVDNYFLTAQECIMAGHFQTIHPNICKLANDGYFGSKFVTVIITGDKNNQIHMEGYQVSNQCMALVRDQCLIPTKDAPELAYVKETTKEQYVPDVFFTEKDKFNNEIKQVARLLPIEYLLIDVPVSAPLEQKYTFNCYQRTKKPFSMENRAIQGHIQDFTSLSEYLSQFKKEDEFLEAVKDFHLLIYLATMDMISFKNDLDKLLDAVKNNDQFKAIEWSKNENWQTLEQLILAQKSANAQAISSPSSFNNLNEISNSTNVNPDHSNNPNENPTNDANQRWSCQHCTFENTSRRSNCCEMCSLPNQF